MSERDELFADRRDAGRRLAAAMASHADAQPIVLALPRGGVPVAYEVAQALNALLEIVLVRKIGAPDHAELGLGAVVDGAEPHTVWNEEVVRQLRPSEEYLEAETRHQLAEIERRRSAYRGDRAPHTVGGRTVIVVDDGIATGGTVRAVLQALAQAGAARRILAVPVAPREALNAIKGEADEVVCLETPDPFYAVGEHYVDFEQTSDAEVIELLRAAEKRWPEAHHS